MSKSKEPMPAFPAPKEGLPDGLTSEWLTGALRHDKFLTDKTSLKIVRIGDIYDYNGVIFRIEVKYKGKEAGLPSTFVLKMAPSNPDSAAREVLFYNKIYPSRPFRDDLTAPRCYWAGGSVVYKCEWSDDGIVDVPDDMDLQPSRPSTSSDGFCAAMIIDDVGEHNIPTICGFGNPNFDSWHHGNIRLTDAKIVVQRLAILHATWWESPELKKGKFPLLAKRREYGTEGPPLWEVLADKWGTVSSLFKNHKNLFARYGKVNAMQKIALAAPITLQHGDLMPPNFRVEEGKVYLFDWEEINVGTAAEELAMYIDQSNFYDDSLHLVHGKVFQFQRSGPVSTRESELVVRDLLQRYYSALNKCGIDSTRYPFPAFIDHFCLSTILFNVAEVVEIEGRELAERVPEIDARFEAVLRMLDQLTGEFVK